MAFDGITISSMVQELHKNLDNGRFNKIAQPEADALMITGKGANGQCRLFVSASPSLPLIYFTGKNKPSPLTAPNFCMLLRKHLGSARIGKIMQPGLERVVEFELEHLNELGDPCKKYLIVELMGKYANVILVGADGKIIDALKRIPPFENQKRVIQPNVLFTPASPQDKKDPFTNYTIDPNVSLTKQFAGFSPFLSREIEYRLSMNESFAAIMQKIECSDSLYVANVNDVPVFHCIPLTSIGECRKYPLMEAFDILYFHKEEKERIKSISGDIYHFVKKELKHQSTKLPRLLKSYDEAKDCEKWKVYGDLLYTYNVNDTKGLKYIELENYEDGAMVKVPLDEKLDGKANARKCFTKYNKLKKGQKYLEEQIAICENEISYFEGLLEQLDLADFETALEIKEELVKQNYMTDKQKKPKKKKKDDGPHLSSITLFNGITVTYGKNNLQNDALTWKLARKSEYWFHTKDFHGSHVLVHSDRLDEETIRTAAMIAAYYSKGRYSSSVPVVYCQIKDLKKIPGAKPGMVQLTSYKTIYIDPDEEYLKSIGLAIS